MGIQRHDDHSTNLRRVLTIAAALVGIGSAAHATCPVTTISDPSSNPACPTPVSFSLGDNYIAGSTDMVSDYFTFAIPTGDELSAITLLSVGDPSTPDSTDQTFFGIASGTSIPSTVSFSSAVGLLGYTLLNSSQLNTNVLPALGASSPPGFPNSMFGATTFTPPLGAGSYSTWILDGDNLSDYRLDFQVSAAPEPSTWALMIAGVGLAGLSLRRRQRRGWDAATT